jgi:hypothetical protein
LHMHELHGIRCYAMAAICGVRGLGEWASGGTQGLAAQRSVLFSEMKDIACSKLQTVV